jgi:hypothetical protein
VPEARSRRVGRTFPEQADESECLKLIARPIAKITGHGGWGNKKVLVFQTRLNG